MMAGLGLLFSALSGGGKALAAGAESDQKLADQKNLEAERSRLEEQKTLRIAEAKRLADRQAGIQQGVDIQSGTDQLQNQRDADAINAANGSQMSAADAAVLRNNPEARKAYGLLASTRQTDLEDRARAAENLGYLDAAGESRRQLQTEIGNERNKNLDEDAKRRGDQQDKRLDAEIQWRKEQAQIQNARESRMLRFQESQMEFNRSRANKEDARAEQASIREMRAATSKSLDATNAAIKSSQELLKDPAVMATPGASDEIKATLKGLNMEAQRYRTALAGAGLEGSQAPSKPFDPDDFAVGGKQAGGKSAKSGTAANPFGLGTADPSKGEIAEAVERPTPQAQAAAGLRTALDKTARDIRDADKRGDKAAVARLTTQMQEQAAALERAKR